jgi:hypothetical protein
MLSQSSSVVSYSYSLRGVGDGGSSAAVAMPPPLLIVSEQRQQQLQQRQKRRSLLTISAEPDQEDNSNNDTSAIMTNDDDNSSNNNNNNDIDNSTGILLVDPTDDDEEELLFFDLYQSPCIVKASNDEFTVADYQAFTVMCNETFFGGCLYDTLQELEQEKATSSTSSIVNWTIVYDYEIYYDADMADPIPAIQHLETIVLEHLSEITGLNEENCDLEQGNVTSVTEDQGKEEDFTISFMSSNGGGRMGSYGAEEVEGDDYRLRRFLRDNYHRPRKVTEYLHDFTDEELSRMLAISSDPSDELDADHRKCTYREMRMDTHETVDSRFLNCFGFDVFGLFMLLLLSFYLQNIVWSPFRRLSRKTPIACQSRVRLHCISIIPAIS